MKEKPTNTIDLSTIENKNLNEAVGQVVYHGEHYSVHTRQYHATTQTFVEREAQRLIDWANLDESVIIQEFWTNAGYTYQTFYDWTKKFPEFKHAHDYAMQKLGVRREMGALTRKYDAGTVHRVHGAYSPIWKEQTRELAQLKDAVAPQNETKIVVIERFPELEKRKTPEEVASAIRKSTSESRYNGSYAIKDQNEL